MELTFRNYVYYLGLFIFLCANGLGFVPTLLKKISFYLKNFWVFGLFHRPVF
jgi:hypothetical protein